MGAVRKKAAPATPYAEADAAAMAAAEAGVAEALAELPASLPISMVGAQTHHGIAMGAVLNWIFKRAEQAMLGDSLSADLVMTDGADKAENMLALLKREMDRMNRMPTAQEKVEAILGARKDVAEYLTSIGKVDVFQHFTKDEICGLIRAAQEGVQRELRQQAKSCFDDEVPF